MQHNVVFVFWVALLLEQMQLALGADAVAVALELGVLIRQTSSHLQ